MQISPAAEISVSETIKTRADGMKQWLIQNSPECFAEQKHLDKGTAERTYWHFGYLSALQDILRLLSPDH